MSILMALNLIVAIAIAVAVGWLAYELRRNTSELRKTLDRAKLLKRDMQSIRDDPHREPREWRH